MSLKTVSTRAGTTAVVIETTAGELEQPTANDFIAMRTDLAISPEFETLENDELLDSLLPGKKILGRKTPSFSTSHYFRAGDSGNFPNYSNLLEGAIGSKAKVAVEQAVTSLGANNKLVFDVADASEYHKGYPVLMQLPTGNELNIIEDVTGNTITLQFETKEVITVGALIGQSIAFIPVDDDEQFPSLSVWRFLPNMRDAAAGIKIEGLDLSFEAGELMDASYSGTGTDYFYDPQVVTATNKFLDFDVSTTEYNVSVPEGVYHDPHELAKALETSLNAAGSGVAFTVSYLDNPKTLEADFGKFEIVGDAAFSILWNTGVNAANSIGTTLGFTATADSGAATEQKSDAAIDLGKFSITPVYDSARPIAAKGHEVLIGEAQANLCVHTSSVNVSLANSTATLGDICADSGIGKIAINGKTLSISMETYLKPHEARAFRYLRTGDRVPFFYGGGEKDGGFVKGKCVTVYSSHNTIDALDISDEDGQAKLSITLSAYAPEDTSTAFSVGMV